jgi:hypothetical protein
LQICQFCSRRMKHCLQNRLQITTNDFLGAAIGNSWRIHWRDQRGGVAANGAGAAARTRIAYNSVVTGIATNAREPLRGNGSLRARPSYCRYHYVLSPFMFCAKQGDIQDGPMVPASQNINFFVRSTPWSSPSRRSDVQEGPIHVALGLWGN